MSEACIKCGKLVDVSQLHDRDRETGGFMHRECPRTVIIKDSESQMRIQIEQAAKGMISGTLREWPHLKIALRYFGVNMAGCCPAVELVKVCKSMVDEGI